MKRSALIALLCIFVVFTATDIVSRELFDRLPHLEDEFAYLYQARIFARGDVYIDTPEPLRAYWQPFLISQDGKRFGKYTPGWPLLLAVGARLDQPWIVNAWLAMLTVALIYRLGREIYNPETGVIAVILAAASPAALLLSGSLMAHTAALFFVTLFVYALWRIEKGRRALIWGGAGGIALGMVLLIRPLTAVGIAAPFVAYYGVRLVWSGIQRARRADWLIPLVILAAVTLLLGMLWPAFNYAVTADDETFPAYLMRFLRGEKDTNLYRTIWDYDTAGFGPGHGRAKNGHSLELGWEHAQKDLQCAARDLFGWAKPSPDRLTDNNPCLKNGPGYSWLLLPFGFLLTIRRHWTWLLLAIPVCLVLIYLTYWIGGALYSARYYSEGLSAVVLISAAGLTTLARLLEQGYRRLNTTLARESEVGFLTSPPDPLSKRRGGGKLGRLSPLSARERGFRGEVNANNLQNDSRSQNTFRVRARSTRLAFSPRWVLYGLVIVAAVYALVIYSPARFRPLRGYGRINQAQIDEVNRLRQNPDQPLVVIVWGDHHWRDVASLMAITDPYLDSEIVLARDPDKRYLDDLIARWPDREKLFYVDGEFSATPPEH